MTLDLDDVVERVKAAAWASEGERQHEPTYHAIGCTAGWGKCACVPVYSFPTKITVHCRMSFTGADWPLEDVLALIASADHVEWTGTRTRHDLLVSADGRHHQFEVPRPAGAEAAP